MSDKLTRIAIVNNDKVCSPTPYSCKPFVLTSLVQTEKMSTRYYSLEETVWRESLTAI